MQENRIIKVTSKVNGQSTTFKMELPDPSDNGVDGAWYEGAEDALGGSEGTYKFRSPNLTLYLKGSPYMLMLFYRFTYPPPLGASNDGVISPVGTSSRDKGTLNPSGGQIKWLSQAIIAPRSATSADGGDDANSDNAGGDDDN
jgi:hypothetical protein